MFIIRQPNGYGSVVCLDKSGKKRRKPWAARITIGWDGSKQRIKYLGYYKTQKEAQLALAKYHMDGVSIDANTVTFEELFRNWCEKNEDTMDEKNLLAYESAYKLVPILHKKKFNSLKSNHLQSALDAVDRKAGTLNKIKTLYSQLYKYALENDIATKNYSEFVHVKTKQEATGTVYSPEEIKKLWELSDTSQIASDILLLIYTGVRIGEAIAIKTEDINLEERYIRVYGTKTDAADRFVPIHEDIVPIIEARSHQPWLLKPKRGTGQLQYEAFRINFRILMDKLNWSHIIHDARKTFVSYMVENGVPIETVKTIVGHAQEGVTASIYLRHRIEHLVTEINKMSLK